VLGRPLPTVAGLCGCDYLLWSWSSDHGFQPLALISGFALPVLLLALAWVILVTLARALGETLMHRRAVLRERALARAQARARAPTPGRSPATAAGRGRRGVAAEEAEPRPADRVAA
jgi:hypothetical protein